MQIGKINNLNQSFGVKFDALSINGFQKRENQILKDYGRDSDEFRQFWEDVVIIHDTHPNDTIFCDVGQDLNNCVSVWRKPASLTGKLQLLCKMTKDDMFSLDKINEMAEAIKSSLK